MSLFMPSSSSYHPILFYSIVMIAALILCPIGAYLSNHQKFRKLLFPLMIVGISVPCITAMVLIFSSHDGVLIADFWRRLFLFKMQFSYLLFILFLMPFTVCLATGISLLFGYDKQQFYVTKEMSVMKGWALLGIVIPLVVAPLIEELGWRGYGVDSLRAYFNLFNTSLIFGALWATWHLPAFFIKGYYQNELWKLGMVYVINFFVSCIIFSFLMNWIYYKTGRSIPAIVLFHAIANFSSMILRTEQFTKCIVTVVLCVLAITMIVYDFNYFFTIS
jgi:membrane protease YdiL (CAAX protease family)